MKKYITYILAALLATTILTVPVYAKSPNKDEGPPSYVLNVLGKKNEWSPNGGFDNPDRHTIFMPLYHDVGDIPEYTKIMVTQPPPGTEGDFQVIDGNGFDGYAELALAQGYYKVYMAALGKPAKNGQKAEADIASYVENQDYEILVELFSDSVSRSKKGPVWEDFSKILYMSYADIYSFFLQYFEFIEATLPYGTPEEWADYYATQVWDWFAAHPDGLIFDLDGLDCIWVFDFLEYLDSALSAVGDGTEYYWTYKNSGLRHLQIRFYKVKDRKWNPDDLPDSFDPLPQV
jgi:hypothetical protein